MARTSNIRSVTRSPRAHAAAPVSPEFTPPSAHEERVLTTRFHRYEALAMALDSASVEVFKADAAVVCRNATTAVEALGPHRVMLMSKMPSADWDTAFAAQDIAEALVVAVERRTAPRKSRAMINATRDELQRLRVPALCIARGLALMGLLPLEDVARIEAGVGLIDTARDGIALSHLFHSHARTIGGMHPFTEAHLARMEALGAELLRSVKPRTARARTAEPSASGPALVDRLWTLLSGAHRTLREGAFIVWGEHYAQHVPTLRTYASAPRSPSRRTPPSPAPPPP